MNTLLFSFGVASMAYDLYKSYNNSGVSLLGVKKRVREEIIETTNNSGVVTTIKNSQVITRTTKQDRVRELEEELRKLTDAARSDATARTTSNISADGGNEEVVGNGDDSVRRQSKRRKL